MRTRLPGYVALVLLTLACPAAGCGASRSGGAAGAKDAGADGSTGGDGSTLHGDSGGGDAADGGP
ncbi:MAG TPA: hypothetical protein VIY73_16390, partial [Polyangiaceae bacterium]